MSSGLYWHTVSPLLQATLQKLMQEPLFNPFRLVGGTALSLQIGHRISIDIDLFTDAAYGSLDFRFIDEYLRSQFPYVSPAKQPVTTGMGMSYILGASANDSIKLDIFYTTEPFIFSVYKVEDIRMASAEEIAAMKMDVVQRGGRKKDFWDIHEFLDRFTIDEMIRFHEKRYPHTHDRELIKENLTEFSKADNDFDPVCLLGKHWEIIKLEIVDLVGP